MIPGTYGWGETVNLDWDKEAQSRAEYFLAQFTNLNHPSLVEVVRDRIWPFYSEWLHKPLGPCSRTAEFDENDDGDITLVTIYIVCEQLPSTLLQQTIKKYTQYLVPDRFKRDESGCRDC